jgi:ribonuclease G
MADKQLIINTNPSETRIALLEKERLSELFIERNRERGIVGNIYLGTVTRVLPGMQAAFVNIGIDRTAFLYGGDVLDPEALEKQKKAAIEAEQARKLGGNDEEIDASIDLSPEDIKDSTVVERRPIEKIIKEGQQVVVQVAKEPLGTKGARVTMFLSLPGRYLVLMPDFTHIGISRRIEDPAERKRLHEIVRQIKPEGVGVIVRTAAHNINAGLLQKDLKYLTKVWRAVDSKKKRSNPPLLLYHDLNLILKTTRDLYSEEIEKIIIDDPEAFEETKRFLTATIPGAGKTLELYEGQTPIFDVYGIEMDIGKALSSRIELPSGGYLIVDQTEALTSFDVNTGKYVGHASAQETILKTNLEAIDKVVTQLRIRNIGGIIVIDFIDMERPEDREMVYNRLQEELQHDKARTNVLRISELGIVQMTRKRTSESLERQLMEPCIYCDGRGRIRSTATEAYDLLREVTRHSLQTGKQQVTVKVRSDIRDWILQEEHELFEHVINKHGLQIDFQLAELELAALNEAPYEVL